MSCSDGEKVFLIVMKLSVKQLAIYLCLVAVGSGAGLLSSRYLWRESHSFQQLKNVTVALPSESMISHSTNGSINAADGDNVNFIATAVQKVGPAVVRINATRKVTNSWFDLGKNPVFQRFFGEDEQPIPPERIERGTGSGFILSENGELLTNAHVVEKTDTVLVTLKDGRTFTGKVVGVDPVTDVAAVKISAQNLPKVDLGNSQNLIPGQWAIAIGNPLGLDNTVTIGIISATDRTSAQVGVPDRRVSFIQTDAAINPGNSGGPLLNAKGEVIGVNTAIRADAQGLGFAIPIETAARVANELFTTGKAEHPFFGVETTDLTPTNKQQISREHQIQIQSDVGVVVKNFAPNSPAPASGLRPGDVIQKINNKPIKTSAQVQKLVDSSKVGDIFTVEVNRNGKMRTLKVELGAYPQK
ncbi:peptidase S1 and S6, chymotrypsin/Hap [Richelia sinica FACHB-800]|uniref:Peptidase S1 and S6, chymotrypsin/Hap n=2 Tax=Richelia TaxID=98443 RepID=A0A975T5T7_9NOST|nr:peptidase S1 and S6, chymotrypsin/Hap [Richelia sinica FACHB-800]